MIHGAHIARAGCIGRRAGRLVVPLLLTLSPAAAADPGQLSLQSGAARVALVELYTSQGCSSCPPADRWLSGLQERPGLWRDFVPLAFHVDYWDYIGWRDPFANAAYSQRQRQYARDEGLSTVYTPGVLLNGAEWRDWRRSTLPPSDHAVAGTLTVRRAQGRLQLRYIPAKPDGSGLRAFVAVLGCGLQSRVSAGENRGRELANDFVVLALRQAPMDREGPDYTLTLADPSVEPLPQATAAARLALAVWVTDSARLAPLQAAGGWLD